ncbi:hypothetical protein EXIGLDRAFT_720664 [Exidia glandulosa HHB12029]|uniref:DUF1776-domain-containing protein n=1 Tax=Exidia glandulosa HHB12029 TaxID=1314781 RepID=A0A165G7D8_EXIGL|nr:hypothetical protein EXIGLDRAFT_720664 [Exidia glandulosa HHB12029]
MGVADSLEAYLHTVESYVAQTVTNVQQGGIQDAAQRIWNDITRYGPPSIDQLPGIGSFSIPPPPPPPAPPAPTLGEIIAENKLISAGAGLGVALAVGYGIYAYRRPAAQGQPHRPPPRRQVVVVLGADGPLGRQLVVDLEAAGYIVIASVASPDAVFTTRAGYTRVLVLDPAQTDALPNFLRSLNATLSIRFPTNTPGDPYLPPSSPHPPYIHALVSLLALEQQLPAPVEALEGQAEHLQRTYLTPLAVIQALIPLLRTTPGPVPQPAKWSRSIVLCTPLPPISTPYNLSTSATNAATHSLAATLRSELASAGVRVLSVQMRASDVRMTASAMMHAWTGSQRNVYGPMFSEVMQAERRVMLALPPTYTASLTAGIINAVSRGAPPAVLAQSFSVKKLWRLVCGTCTSQWRGSAFTLGSGLTTHAMARSLPSVLVDILLAVPVLFASLRNAVLPLPPPPAPAPGSTLGRPLPRPPPAPVQRERKMIEQAETVMKMPEPMTVSQEALQHHLAEHGQEHDAGSGSDIETSSFSGTVSDADLDFESGEDHDGAQTGAWVSLRDRRNTVQPTEKEKPAEAK